MLIRKNSRKFKAIRNILLEYRQQPSREALIRLYITKAGHKVKDRIAIEGIKEGKDIFYNMTYETILASLLSQEYQLLESDDKEGMYYFHRTSDKTWDETPFELDEQLRNKFDHYASLPVTSLNLKPAVHTAGTKEGTGSAKSRPPVKRKEEKKKKSPSGDKHFPEFRFKERKQIPADHTRVERKFPPFTPKEKSPMPDYGLKHPIAFHHPDRLFAPELKLTKKEVLDYYDKISPWLLPYLKDRPVFLQRAEENAEGAEYIRTLESLREQWKEVLPGWLKTKIYSSETPQEDRHYLLCPDKTHLLFFVDTGCIALHPLNSRLQSMHYPDYQVISLHAGDLEFDKVIEVALAAKEVLDAIRITSFIKTSGDKDLHLYIPLGNRIDADTGKKICLYICKLLHLKLPELTLINEPDEQRKDKVHLGINDESVVAPYSLRANRFAGVSAPLFWDEVKTDLRAEDINYKTIFEKLAQRGDPFGELFTTRVNGKKLLERLEENYSFLL